MNEINPNEENLLLREVLSEGLIRDTIVFLSAFLFIISQEWKNILLLFFPIVNFIFFIFFKIIATNRNHLVQVSNLIYYPLGSEKKNSSRLYFASMFLSIILLWMGYESYLHPQLIDNFFLSFSILFILIFTFSFLWIFIDIWRYARIKIKFENKKIVFSTLSKNLYLRIILSEFSLFLVLNFLNLLFTLFLDSEFLSIFPGLDTGRFNLSYLFGLYCIILIITPIMAIINLNIMYRYLHYHDREVIRAKFETFPEDVQDQIKTKLNLKLRKIIFDEELE